MTEPNERTEPDERNDPQDPGPTPPLSPPPPVDMPGAAVAAAETSEPPVEPEPEPEPAAAPVGGAPPTEPPADGPKSTDWREPPWFPPRDKDRPEPKSNIAAIVVGLIILAVGVYFLFDRTLGVPMPPIQWSSVWPILLIVIGGIVLIRSMQRR
jgi:uncharacterized membrane protein